MICLAIANVTLSIELLTNLTIKDNRVYNLDNNSFLNHFG